MAVIASSIVFPLLAAYLRTTFGLRSTLIAATTLRVKTKRHQALPTRCAVQLAQFSVCVVIARMLCGTVVIVGTGALAPVAAALDRAFRGHPALLLYFVMVACPVCMNTGQAWLQDQFLKWAAWGPSGALSSGATASPRRSDGDWAELGALADGTRARPDDLDERPGPGKLARGGSGPGGDPAARASVAQRQRTPARDATQDWRVRPPHS